MKLRMAAFAALGALLLCAQAPAPGGDMMTHYRAYRAALTSGDLAAAETSAAAALAASVARDGQGGRTAIMAINLAQLRLNRGKRAEAYEPALQAFTVASARADAGVDPLLATLVLGRSELTEAHDRDGRQRLTRAIEQAAGRADLVDEAYNAAADLGRWLWVNNAFAPSANAWHAASEFADPSDPARRYAHGEALLGEGISRFAASKEQQDLWLSRSADTNLPRPTNDMVRADATLAEATNVLAPMAHVRTAAGVDVTAAQSSYALALTWRKMLEAYAISSNQQLELPGLRAGVAPEGVFVGRADESGIGVNYTPCRMRVVVDPMPEFPAAARTRVNVGAVTVRVLMNESGGIDDIRVAAAVPASGFREETERVLPRWRVERLADSPATCTVPPVQFTTIRFQYH